MTGETVKAIDAAERLMRTCDVLAEFVATGCDRYLTDVRTQWAVEMGLVRLGEDVSRIPEGVRSRFPDQPWRIIIDLRNIAAHQDDSLTTRRVWDTLVHDIPALRAYAADVIVPALRGELGADR